MDPLTQGLVGAALPQSFADSDHLRRASIIGGLAGFSADLDVLIRSADDPLLFLDFHRHFSHALVFIPIGALMAALPCYFLMRKKLPFKKVWLFAILGYATHGLLDACTSYGTQLLWPFSNWRVAWNNVAVIDPFLTLPLGILVLIAFAKRRLVWGRAALIFGLTYLLFGVIQRDRALGVAEALAASRGHQVSRIEVKPSIGNLWLWRAIYQTERHFHVDAVWAPPFATAKIYDGGQVPVVQLDRDFPGLRPDSVQGRDFRRFSHFSDRFVMLHPHDSMVVGDARYAILPHQLLPLWGITISVGDQDQHVEYHNFRNVNDETWDLFRRMLLGRPLPQD